MIHRIAASIIQAFAHRVTDIGWNHLSLKLWLAYMDDVWAFFFGWASLKYQLNSLELFVGHLFLQLFGKELESEQFFLFCWI